MKSQKKELGFTLIELVVVILVLGILAVTIASKFIDFRRDGEIARVKAVAASFKQSLTFAHTKWQIIGGSEAYERSTGFCRRSAGYEQPRLPHRYRQEKPNGSA